jgi:aryl-alcohol dehydrogenase-like predicted oxidoreductase
MEKTYPSGNHKVPAALGTMAMTGCYGEVARKDAIETVHAFLDAGYSCIDTADLYADGENEELIGEAIKGRRDKVMLVSKFGFVFGKTSDTKGLDARPERVEKCCDASLKRLGVDHLDLYYLHRVDPNVPVADTVGAMARLVEKGKVKALGICELSEGTLMKAMAVHPIEAVQCEYSLWSRDPERNILGVCERLGLSFFGYAPLGRGFLTGQIKSPSDIPEGDQRHEYPRFKGENFKKNLELVERVKDYAATLKVTPAQLAIAWIRRTGQVTPILGATTAAQIKENLAALKIQLSKEQLHELESVLPASVWAGDRYPASAMKRLDADVS